MGAMIEMRCRKCQRSASIPRTYLPDAPDWAVRIDLDTCATCDDPVFSVVHWIDANGKSTKAGSEPEITEADIPF